MHKPEILILDEPMNGLDPIGIYEMREYLVNLCKEGNTTVFISSHILSEIEQISGLCIIAAAIPSLCFIPKEYFSKIFLSFLSKLTTLKA